MLKLWISWDGDGIGARIGDYRLKDNVEEMKHVSTAIEDGNKVFARWAESHGGTITQEGGDEGCLEMDAQYVNELPGICKKYYEVTGATVSVGIGTKLSESSKALLISKLNGKNQATFWEPEMDAQLNAVHQQSEGAKLNEQYLSKAIGHAVGVNPYQQGRLATALPKAPTPNGANLDDEGQILSTIDQSQKHQPPPLDIKPTPEQPSFVDLIHKYATMQAAHDQQPIHAKNQEWQDLKQRVAQTLMQVKENAPILEEIQEAAPETYDAILALTDSVIELARALKEQNPEEAEAFQKALKTVMPLPKSRNKKRVTLPVGTALNGKVKVKKANGDTHWANVKDGQVLSADGLSPISSRYPDEVGE